MEKIINIGQLKNLSATKEKVVNEINKKLVRAVLDKKDSIEMRIECEEFTFEVITYELDKAAFNGHYEAHWSRDLDPNAVCLRIKIPKEVYRG